MTTSSVTFPVELVLASSEKHFDNQPRRIIQRRQVDAELPPVSETQQGGAADDKTARLLRELSRVQKLQYYLRSLVRNGDVDSSTALQAWRVWHSLSCALSNTLPVPDAASGPNGEILYTWNARSHHFELEIFPDGRAEFFYINHDTDDMWSADYTGDPLPDVVRNGVEPFLLYG